MADKEVDWFLVNQLVPEEHQYRDAIDPPLEAVRMAWPFKTEEERELIRKWMRKQNRIRKIEMVKLEEAPF